MKRNFTVWNWRIEPWVVLAIAALIAVLFQLIVSAHVFRVGFPLDDTWIHLTYARNFAEHGEWAFRLGERSAGSTSPLWTALLSIGFLIDLAPYVWTYLLGWAVLTLLAICAEHTTRKLAVAYPSRVPWAGLFFVFAWHLTWSAVSGMETLLHGLILFVVLSALLRGSRRYLALGLLAGLSLWVRPDGMTLLGPLLFMALLAEKTWYLRGEALWKTLLGFGSLFFPYVLFNLALSDNPLPNTFYAKQAEYGEFWSSLAFSTRVTNYLWPFLVSPFLALIPAALAWLVKTIRARNWAVVASLIWFAGYIGIFFTRIPAYQHGRYIIPTLPVLYLWGVVGFLDLIHSSRLSKHVVFAWQALILALVVVFQWVGARQNAEDVFVIESEMRFTAEWVQDNLPRDARLAVHDIGVLGYSVQNPLVDMAGILTPEVVPFIRDEARLADYLDANSVDYLITFPSFYPQLTAQKNLVFEAGLKSGRVPSDNHEHIRVYRWR